MPGVNLNSFKEFNKYPEFEETYNNLETIAFDENGELIQDLDNLWISIEGYDALCRDLNDFETKLEQQLKICNGLREDTKQKYNVMLDEVKTKKDKCIEVFRDIKNLLQINGLEGEEIERINSYFTNNL